MIVLEAVRLIPQRTVHTPTWLSSQGDRLHLPIQTGLSTQPIRLRAKLITSLWNEVAVVSSMPSKSCF